MPDPRFSAADRVIGLLGGSFDPVHNGHLHIAARAREAFGLAEVVFMPAGYPPHKPGQALAPAAHRLAMLRLATQDESAFVVSRMEIERPGPSYTVETLETFAEEDPATEVRLLLGADMLPDLHKWYRVRDILALTRPIVANRPGVDVTPAPGRSPADALREALDPSMHPYAAGLADGLLSIAPSPASSTEVRRRRREGEPIDELVPHPVRVYIEEKDLYSGDSGDSGEAGGPDLFGD